MNELAIKLHEAAIVLENDGDFYRKYTSLRGCYASTRRDGIHRALVANKVDQGAMVHAYQLRLTDLHEHLRRYLDDVWHMPPPVGVSTDSVSVRWKELKFWEDSVKYPPVRLPDDIELQTIDGEDWHVTRRPDGSICYSLATARKVWEAFRGASGMGYMKPTRSWGKATRPTFSGDWPYRWKPEFTFKLLEQEASEAKVQETPKFGGLQHNNIWIDEAHRVHGVDAATFNIWKEHTLAYINNLLETQAKETIMNHAINTAAINTAAINTAAINTAAINTAAIVITTKTLVNGVDISTMADSAIYDLIAKQEAAVADLEKIDNKPKKLVSEIAKRKAGIQALVDYLDSKEPADKADDASANASA